MERKVEGDLKSATVAKPAPHVDASHAGAPAGRESAAGVGKGAPFLRQPGSPHWVPGRNPAGESPAGKNVIALVKLRLLP